MRKILFETERLSVGKFLPEDYNDSCIYAILQKEFSGAGSEGGAAI